MSPVSVADATRRQQCKTETCFASFSGRPGREDEVRYCNRSGPDGGHPHRWDGTAWQLVGTRMQHDRS